MPSAAYLSDYTAYALLSDYRAVWQSMCKSSRADINYKSISIGSCGGRLIRFNTNAKLRLKRTPSIPPSISRRAQPCREASNKFPIGAGGWLGSVDLLEEGVKGALCSAVDLDGTQRWPQSALSDPLSRGRRAASANSATFKAVER
ncbi:uncharacterized [Tachysurus ichikawai]